MRPAILVALLALTIGSHDECTDDDESGNAETNKDALSAC